MPWLFAYVQVTLTIPRSQYGLYASFPITYLIIFHVIVTYENFISFPGQCDIVIYRKNVYLVISMTKYVAHIYLDFIHSFWLIAPKTLGISWAIRAKYATSCSQFLKTLRRKWLLGGSWLPEEPTMLELSVPLPDFSEGERGWRLNQLPMANDLVNYDYAMKLP